VGTEVGRVVATDPDLSRLLVYRLDYNRSEGRREDGALVSPADWQAGRGADPGGGGGRLQLWGGKGGASSFTKSESSYLSLSFIPNLDKAEHGMSAVQALQEIRNIQYIFFVFST
jgi:hypothetical protein